MAENPIKQVVPDFELLAKVGEGSYGEVYLAKSQTGQYRAVKIIHRNRMGSDEAFDREFRGAKVYEVVSRKHEALIDILHVGCDAERGFFYYVMDAADDERQGRNFDPSTYRPRTLRYELATRTALPVEECIAIGLRLAAALVFLQQHGLIHRDIKPSNVVFIDGQLKLADIGLVVDVREAKSLVGTPGYEPPEHHGAFSGDVYSLGKLLYEISTGQSGRDFGEAPTDEADTDDPRFPQLNKIILKACASHFKDRYQTAFGLFKALQELQKGTEIPKRQSGIRYVPLLRLVLKGAAGLVLGSVITWFSWFSSLNPLLPTIQKRFLGKDATEWTEAWNQYWTSVQPEKMTTYVNLPNGEMPEEHYVMPGPKIPMGPWRRISVEGVDPFKMAEVQIGFSNFLLAQQVSLVMKGHNGRTGTLDGEYETRGKALRLEFTNAKGARVDRYYFVLEDNRLVLENWNCSMTFEELPTY